MNYLIADKTANHDAIYIGDHEVNTSLEENAVVYATKEQAEQIIIENNWQE